MTKRAFIDVSKKWKLDRYTRRFTQNATTKNPHMYAHEPEFPKSKSVFFYEQFRTDRYLWIKCSKDDARQIMNKFITRNWFIMTKPLLHEKNKIILIVTCSIDIIEDIMQYFRLVNLEIVDHIRKGSHAGFVDVVPRRTVEDAI